MARVFLVLFFPTHRKQKQKKISPESIKKKNNLTQRCLLLQSTSSKLSHRDLWNTPMQQKLNKKAYSKKLLPFK